MTKEEILAMEAGLELDRLVEEVIFDHKEAKIIEAYSSVWVGNTPSPFYSTDHSAAWQVVEKMPPPFQIHRCLDNTWWVIFGFRTWMKPRIAAKTAPEAICKAALFAKLEAGQRCG